MCCYWNCWCHMIYFIWFISSFFDIGTLHDDTLGGLPGILFLAVPYSLHLASPLEVFQVLFVPVSPYELPLVPPLEVSQVFLSVFEHLELVPVVAVALWGICALLVRVLILFTFPPHTAIYYECLLIVYLLL